MKLTLEQGGKKFTMSRKKYNQPQLQEEEVIAMVEEEPVIEEPVIEEEVATVEEEEKPIFMEQDEYMEYIQNQAKSIPEEEKTPVARVSMFQMNKDLVRGLKTMTNMEINIALEKIQDWADDIHHKDREMRHYALLNHEKHYFTIFAYNSTKRPVRLSPAQNLIREVKDVLTNHYGDCDIRSIEVETIDGKPSGAVEIWAMWNGEPTVAYLFPYEQGVVYY